MTYKLESSLSRIVSPVVLSFPDGSQEEYRDGSAVTEAVFDKRYMVDEMKAVGSRVEITLKEITAPITSWIGEEQTFF